MTRIVIRAELSYEADEGVRVSKRREQRPALATIMPDGTVIAGDAFPAPPRYAPVARASSWPERGRGGLFPPVLGLWPLWCGRPKSQRWYRYP
jgi:hypothetical protein